MQKNTIHINTKFHKGFTLVELAIVLVVIGLLLGMAFKGKSLIEAAKIKADIIKIEKINSALHVYFAKFNTMPGKRADGTYTDKSIRDALITSGLISDREFRADFLKTSYHFIGCSAGVGKDAQGDIIWDAWAISEDYMLCVYASDNNATDTVVTDRDAINVVQPMKENIVCHIETILDDRNIFKGDGRHVLSSNQGGYQSTVGDCSKNKQNIPSYKYLFRVF